jgi:hypothetical protein
MGAAVQLAGSRARWRSADRKGGSTKAQDLYGTRLHLTRDGLFYGEEFVPLDEIDGTRPASDSLWNPATSLFEVTVFRRHGPPLVVRNLPLPIADRLRKSVIGALRERRL